MLDILFCGYNISCHLKNLNGIMNGPKYPAEYVEICQYFEKQKVELPDYCKIEAKPVRRRNEF